MEFQSWYNAGFLKQEIKVLDRKTTWWYFMTFVLFSLTDRLGNTYKVLAVIRFMFVIGIIEALWSSTYNYYKKLENV